MPHQESKLSDEQKSAKYKHQRDVLRREYALVAYEYFPFKEEPKDLSKVLDEIEEEKNASSRK